MKKAILAILLVSSFTACNNKKKKDAPDVSGIAVNATIERFDKDFFALDTNNLLAGLNALHQKQPVLTNIFLQDVLGADSIEMLEKTKSFLRMSGTLRDTVNIVFKNTDKLEKEFKEGFQYLKHYFPAYAQPGLATIAGPMDAIAESGLGPTPNFLRPGLLGISLQFYLGKDFSVYKDPFFIREIVPSYRSRRFSKEYIIADAMNLIVMDMFPYTSGDKPLIEQMVEKGKRWYLLDQLLPHVPDSVKTGYTQLQLDWCAANEGLIWSDIIKSGDLQSLSPATIQTYLGEGPFTQGFSQEYSPGNMGQWIGWQIVKKYISKNAGLSPAELMNTPATKIIEDAKYKPK